VPFTGQLNKESLYCMVNLPQLHLFTVVIPLFSLIKVELTHLPRCVYAAYTKKGDVK